MKRKEGKDLQKQHSFATQTENHLESICPKQLEKVEYLWTNGEYSQVRQENMAGSAQP